MKEVASGQLSVASESEGSDLVVIEKRQNEGHGSGGGDSSGWTGSGLGGDPGPMRSRSCIESASIARSERGFIQPRMGRQFLAWRRQPQESRVVTIGGLIQISPEIPF